MSKRQHWDSVIVIGFGLIVLSVALSLMFSGCSVKILTFGNETIKEHQDYIIGAKTTKTEETK